MRLVAIGDNTVDDYTHLRTRFPGGNALNVAVYARRLGCESAYLGVFGSDAEAEHMQKTLVEAGVDISHCSRAEGPSGRASLSIENGERVFTGSNGGGVRRTVSMEFIFAHADYLRPFPIAHTGAYSFMDEHLPRLRTIVQSVSYDFSDDFEPERALSLCPHVDIAFFSCSGWEQESTVDLLREAVGRGSSVAIATRGPRDAILFDGRRWLRQAPRPVTPIDTLGAGDAFITAFLVSQLQARTGKARVPDAPGGSALERSLERAASFAAEICGVQGAFGQGLGY